MDVNKNSYTLGFAAIMVIIVAALLSLAAIVFKEPKDRNVELEKKQNILQSVGIDVSREQSELEYSTYIKKELVLNNRGEVVNKYKTSYLDSLLMINNDESNELLDDINKQRAFSIDLSKEIKKDISEQKLPLYIAEVEGETKYIIPLRGKGLWGPIWGFISFNDDLNTVFAAVFDHKKETPGLGAEINTPEFQIPFTGKTIFEEDKFVPIIVQKGGANGNIHKVDAISGGTITSDGVTDMIEERLERYMPYFEKLSPEMQVKHIINLVELDENLDSTSNISERIIN
mgnify:FL=1